MQAHSCAKIQHTDFISKNTHPPTPTSTPSRVRATAEPTLTSMADDQMNGRTPFGIWVVGFALFF